MTDDVNARGPYGGTALLEAVEADDLDAARALLARGADVTLGENISAKLAEFKPRGPKARLLHGLANWMSRRVPGLKDMPDTIITPAYAAYSADMARLLAEHGAPIGQFEAEMVPHAVGADRVAPSYITPEMFNAQYAPRAGASNPEKVDIPVWREQIRTGKSGWAAAKDFVGKRNTPAGCGGADPVWSFQRFGRTATRLEDGRWVLIAGEHEDHYDPDFCIYADVTVIHPSGALDHYIYPAADFPPTDFHSATLVNDTVFVIGNYSYPHLRTEGVTQVLKLSLEDYSVTRVDARGEQPGWISHHEATRDGDRILVWGGKIEPGYRDNHETFALDLKTMVWSRL